MCVMPAAALSAGNNIDSFALPSLLVWMLLLLYFILVFYDFIIFLVVVFLLLLFVFGFSCLVLRTNEFNLPSIRSGLILFVRCDRKWYFWPRLCIRCWWAHQLFKTRRNKSKKMCVNLVFSFIVSGKCLFFLQRKISKIIKCLWQHLRFGRSNCTATIGGW